MHSIHLSSNAKEYRGSSSSRTLYLAEPSLTCTPHSSKNSSYSTTRRNFQFWSCGFSCVAVSCNGLASQGSNISHSLSQECTSRIIRMNIFHGDYALLLSLNHFASIFGCGLLLEEDYIKYFTPGRLPRDDLDEISPDTYPEQVFWRSRNKTQCIKDRRLLYIPAIYDFRDVTYSYIARRYFMTFENLQEFINICSS